MNKIFTILIFTLLLCFTAFSQNFKEQYKAVDQTKNFVKQKQIIDEWEKARPKDPELYVAYFKHYIGKSREEVVSFSKNKEGTSSVGLTSEKSGKVESYLNSQIVFEEKNFKLAIKYIDKGILMFPNRLDMRFGKVHILGQKQDYDVFSEEIIKTVNYSNENKNKWVWIDNEALEKPKVFMLSAIQDYVVQLYNAGDSNSKYIKYIAETVLKHYPKSVENLTNLSVHYLIKKNYKNALVYLLRAEKIAPTDPVVLSNIAWCYYKTNDKLNAIKYYELAKKHGNGQLKENAVTKLKELRAK